MNFACWLGLLSVFLSETVSAGARGSENAVHHQSNPRSRHSYCRAFKGNQHVYARIGGCTILHIYTTWVEHPGPYICFQWAGQPVCRQQHAGQQDHAAEQEGSVAEGDDAQDPHTPGAPVTVGRNAAARLQHQRPALLHPGSCLLCGHHKQEQLTSWCCCRCAGVARLLNNDQQAYGAHVDWLYQLG